MRIVHIEDFFHPDAGYQVNLLSRLQVLQGHEVVIVSAEMKKLPSSLTAFFGKENIDGRDEKFREKTGARIIRVPVLGYYSGRVLYNPKIFKTVNNLYPDVVFVHGSDTFIGMQYLWSSSRLRYPIVVDNHMVEMASVNKLREIFRLFYKVFVTPKILKNHIPLVRVADVDYVEKCLGVPLKTTTLLSFGTDTEYFKPDEKKKQELRKSLNIGDEDFVALYAGKLDMQKGGQFFATAIIKKLVLSKGNKIVFLIVGNTIGEYGKAVENIFGHSENRIIRFTTQAYSDLLSFYQAADIAMYPRQCSMSFFEAQSCGLPVLLEDNDVNKQRALYGNAILFKSENVGEFRQKFMEYAEMGKEKMKAMGNSSRQYVMNNYDFVPVAEKFTEVLYRAVKDFKGKREARNR